VRIRDHHSQNRKKDEMTVTEVNETRNTLNVLLSAINALIVKAETLPPSAQHADIIDLLAQAENTAIEAAHGLN
jgi:hypothetical protein